MTAEATCTLEPPSPANSDADCSVSDLVARARSGDRQAWDALVERYAPLIWSICRRHRLGRADADDVGQSVWLRLLDQLDRVASRPRCPAGSLPPPGGNASASCPRHRDRTRPFTRWTLRASRTSGPGRPTRNCWRPSATPRCARRSPSCPRTASSYWPCSPRTRPRPTPTSAPSWASPSAASARPAAATSTRSAATPPSPPSSTPSSARPDGHHCTRPNQSDWSQ